MKSNWLPPKKVDPQQVESLAHFLNVRKVIAQILVQKGITSLEEAKKFLSPNLKDLHHYSLFPGIDKGIDRVIKGIARGEKILIYGDYDVDGVTGVSMLYEGLSALNIKPIIYIPHRLKEGYGLTETGIRYCKEIGASLVITVDCGITALKEVHSLTSSHIDVIILDHHEPQTVLPPAFTIINPKLEGYPFPHLCGCGVGFKFLEGIYDKLNKTFPSYLDYVALATICDIVPLIDENRIFVKYGLEELKRTKKIALKTLIEKNGLKDKNLTPYHLSFIIGPQLNAKGRLGEAYDVVNFLTTYDEYLALRMVSQFIEINRERQKLQDKILKEAIEEIEKHNLTKKKILIVTKKGWHPGVIGIVASKLQEKYFRPTLIISVEDGIGRGSGRSLPFFPLYESLAQFSELFETFGGHKIAVGFKIRREKIEELKEKLEEYAEVNLNWEQLFPKVPISCELKLEEIDETLIQQLKKLEPFGLGNSTPIFLTNSLQIVGYPDVVKNAHLKFKIREEGGKILKAIGFGLGGIPITTGAKVNIVYEIKEESYLQEKEIVLHIKDIEII
jgi:single-stranded-DNA-specific exonuclease